VDPRLAKILMVAGAGSLGALARYALQGWVQRMSGSTFPWGTLAVNMLGCLAIGLIMHLALERQALSDHSRVLLTVGFLGAFTTYSTFGYETFALLRERDVTPALLNVGASVVLGLAAVWLGWAAGKVIWP
jgi:CrcB protein